MTGLTTLTKLRPFKLYVSILVIGALAKPSPVIQKKSADQHFST